MVKTATKSENKGGFRKGGEGQKHDLEMEQKIIDLARVTRVMAGGKRMRFRACVVIGDKKGKVGIGLAKGADVTIAINKAVNQAKKKLITVPIVKETIPHFVKVKKGASKLLIKPAPPGTGVKAGGIVRMIFEVAGIPNISSKIIGANNKINNARAAIEALQMFKVKRVEKNKQKENVKPVKSETKKTLPVKSVKTEKKEKEDKK